MPRNQQGDWMDRNKIMVFVTGGTFDKEYDELHGKLFFKDTHVAEMLKVARCKVDLEVRTLMMMDSLDMTPSDRKIIADNCKSTPSRHIVIAHGTDTMVETAAILAKEIKDKTIVLTGAMIPYKFGSSDGLFNLGSALAFAQALPHGVYVAMNGRYFNWNEVRKNREIGEFEKI